MVKKLLVFLFLCSPLVNASVAGGKLAIQGGYFSSGPIITPIVSGGSGCTSVLFDSSTAGTLMTGADPIVWNMTIGALTNRFLVVGCGSNSGNTVTGITVGGNAMTLSTNSTISGTSCNAGACNAVLYTYKNPPSGSQTISVALSAGSDNRFGCGAVSYSCVNQTTPIDTSTGTINSPGSGTNTITFTTTVANDALVDIINKSVNGLPTAGSGQTVLWKQDLTSDSTSVASSSTTAVSPGSYSMTWTGIGSSQAQQLGLALKVAP